MAIVVSHGNVISIFPIQFITDYLWVSNFGMYFKSIGNFSKNKEKILPTVMKLYQVSSPFALEIDYLF